MGQSLPHGLATLLKTACCARPRQCVGLSCHVCVCVSCSLNTHLFFSFSLSLSHTHTLPHTHTICLYAGLSGAGVAGIVISVTILVSLTILSSIYLIRIMAKLVEVMKRRHQQTKVTVSSAEPSLSYPLMIVEMQTTDLQSLVLEPEPTTAPESAASSLSTAEPKEPQNPQLSAEAPPSYQDADQFQLVTEEDAPDLDKPPPYMDPVHAMGGAAYALPIFPPYLSTGPDYPPTYPPTGTAYPPAYPPIVTTTTITSTSTTTTNIPSAPYAPPCDFSDPPPPPPNQCT